MYSKIVLIALILLKYMTPIYGQRTAIVYLRMEHNGNAYSAYGDGFFEIDNNTGVSGKINWKIIKRDDGSALPIFLELVKGHYDAEHKKFNLSGTSAKDTLTILNRYDLDAQPQYLMSGIDVQKNATGEKTTDLSGFYYFSYKPRVTTLSGEQDARLVGLWRVMSGTGSEIFSNRYVEIFPDGVGLSRNDSLNTIKNVRLFDLREGLDSVWISGTGYQAKIDGPTLSLKRQTEGKILTYSLKRINSNPLQFYRDTIPIGPGTANWLAKAVVRKNMLSYGVDTLADRHNELYDIHPFSGKSGEMVVYTYDSVIRPKIPLGSMIFMGYFYGDHGQDTVLGLNNPYMRVVSWKFSDGIIILHKHDTTFYLVKTGLPQWRNLYALHEQYNARNGGRILDPPNSSWVVCPDCSGRGEFSLGKYEKQKIGEYDNLGHPITREIENFETCQKCGGNGGWYVDQTSGERLDMGGGWLRDFLRRRSAETIVR